MLFPAAWLPERWNLKDIEAQRHLPSREFNSVELSSFKLIGERLTFILLMPV